MYIAHDGNLIWGIGDTAEAALAAAQKMIGVRGDVDDVWPEPQASINKTLDSLEAVAATSALVRDVDARGGDISWGYLDGVACTRDEESDAA
jgi:hypothetical protein